MRSVDVHTLLSGVVAKALRLCLCDDCIVTFAFKVAGWWIEFRRLEEMQGDQS